MLHDSSGQQAPDFDSLGNFLGLAVRAVPFLITAERHERELLFSDTDAASMEPAHVSLTLCTVAHDAEATEHAASAYARCDQFRRVRLNTIFVYVTIRVSLPALRDISVSLVLIGIFIVAVVCWRGEVAIIALGATSHFCRLQWILI